MIDQGPLARPAQSDTERDPVKRYDRDYLLSFQNKSEYKILPASLQNPELNPDSKQTRLKRYDRAYLLSFQDKPECKILPASLQNLDLNSELKKILRLKQEI